MPPQLVSIHATQGTRRFRFLLASPTFRTLCAALSRHTRPNVSTASLMSSNPPLQILLTGPSPSASPRAITSDAALRNALSSSPSHLYLSLVAPAVSAISALSPEMLLVLISSLQATASPTISNAISNARRSVLSHPGDALALSRARPALAQLSSAFLKRLFSDAQPAAAVLPMPLVAHFLSRLSASLHSVRVSPPSAAAITTACEMVLSNPRTITLLREQYLELIEAERIALEEDIEEIQNDPAPAHKSDSNTSSTDEKVIQTPSDSPTPTPSESSSSSTPPPKSKYKSKSEDEYDEEDDPPKKSRHRHRHHRHRHRHHKSGRSATPAPSRSSRMPATPSTNVATNVAVPSRVPPAPSDIPDSKSSKKSSDRPLVHYKTRFKKLIRSAGPTVRAELDLVKSAPGSEPKYTKELCCAMEKSALHVLLCHYNGKTIEERAIKTLKSSLARKLSRAGASLAYVEHAGRLASAMIVDPGVLKVAMPWAKKRAGEAGSTTRSRSNLSGKIVKKRRKEPLIFVPEDESSDSESSSPSRKVVSKRSSSKKTSMRSRASSRSRALPPEESSSSTSTSSSSSSSSTPPAKSRRKKRDSSSSSSSSDKDDKFIDPKTEMKSSRSRSRSRSRARSQSRSHGRSKSASRARSRSRGRSEAHDSDAKSVHSDHSNHSKRSGHSKKSSKKGGSSSSDSNMSLKSLENMGSGKGGSRSHSKSSHKSGGSRRSSRRSHSNGPDDLPGSPMQSSELDVAQDKRFMHRFRGLWGQGPYRTPDADEGQWGRMSRGDRIREMMQARYYGIRGTYDPRYRRFRDTQGRDPRYRERSRGRERKEDDEEDGNGEDGSENGSENGSEKYEQPRHGGGHRSSRHRSNHHRSGRHRSRRRRRHRYYDHERRRMEDQMAMAYAMSRRGRDPRYASYGGMGYGDDMMRYRRW